MNSGKKIRDMSKFFEMWSNIDITLSEFDAFYYIYSQMLNQIENKIGMKCSQLKADTYIGCTIYNYHI